MSFQPHRSGVYGGRQVKVLARGIRKLVVGFVLLGIRKLGSSVLLLRHMVDWPGLVMTMGTLWDHPRLFSLP